MIDNNAISEIQKQVCNTDFIDWGSFRDKTILITGATGLIGYTLISSLTYTSKQKNLRLKIIALVRNEKRAKERFKDIYSSEDCLNGSELGLIIGTVESLPSITDNVDYIIHGASKTASMSFIKEPVETIKTALLGTINLLELAKEKTVSGFVYLSSMEVYGYPEKGHKVVENDIGTLPPQDLRNSYPISKVQCESLCMSYAAEYNMPVMIARLTQTFGPGVNYDDRRIFAYFGKCVVEKNDIVLKTKGETERSYLYTSDAVTAILTILLKGQPGKAYNVADEKTYCSIAEMARKIADKNDIKVAFDEKNTPKKNGYPDTLYMDLDTSQLCKLGWFAQFGESRDDNCTDGTRFWL